MSSSSVCQGLQSCLEPRVIEPRVLRLKLAPPGSNFSRPSGWPCSSSSSSRASPSYPDTQEKPLTNNTATPPPAVTIDECDIKDKNALLGGGCWSFLQSLADISHRNKTEEPETEKVYVHPTVTRSSSMLSAKSLEMCTESLGSETGSNAGDSSDDISLFSLESSFCFTRHTLEANRNSGSKRMNRAGTFPPPLTSITDLGGVRVRPHREDGRLILEAVTSPSPHPYFQAERSNGRLRLRLFESFVSDSDDEVADDEGIGEKEGNDEEEAETQNQEACGEEEDSGAEEEECSGEELEEYIDNVEDEMGMTKFARPSRCKESGNRDIFGDGYFELHSLSLCL